MSAPFRGAVLTGGRSTRMGTDKALLHVRGTPLAVVARDALTAAGARAPVLAVGGDEAQLATIGFSYVADAWPGEGPLGGIVTALEAVDGRDPDAVVAVLACDLPFVAPPAVRQLVGALRAAPEARAAVARADGRRHVVLGAWRTSAAPVLRAAFAAGERAPRRVLEELEAIDVELDDPAWARNANRVDDLAAWGLLG